ncbi:glycoside hydrolase family 105 protein [Saccharicrinis sp. FJH2]|uniref:glycoside hydrolase family 88/105 protein n=1 Tax=Saccharicrinis sp. FJH65 TaxID=3344659 RepID=UPI0035F26ED8
MKIFYLFTILLFAVSCKSNPKATAKSDDTINFALEFADAVMARNDSLIHYNGNRPKYEYDYAFLGSAMNKLGKYDKKYSKYMKDYIDYFVHDDGHIDGYKMSDYNIDRVRPGLNMLELYSKTGDKKYQIAIKTLVEQMKGQPRTNSGGFWHKKRYPYQMWLDGIYMASPFLARYAHDFDKPEWYDEVVFQITEIYRHVKDEKTGLVYHAWDESKQQKWCNPETGQSKHFWSRGTGWYVMAIVDVLDYLPQDHPGREKLIAIIRELSDALLKVRDEQTGLWYQVMDMGGREGNYIEASGSAMITYAYAKGAKNGYLDKEYFDIAKASLESIRKNLVKTDEQGLPVLIQTVGGCGLGGNPYRMADYEYYISERQVDNDQKGIAPVILSAIELSSSYDQK